MAKKPVTDKVPTVFVGVGGMGQSMVRSIRSKIKAMARSGAPFVPQMYQYVLLDPKPLKPDDDESIPGFPREIAVRMSTYTSNTVQHLLATPEYKDAAEWYYPNYKTDPTTGGYLQIRVNGRFGLKMSAYQVPSGGQMTVSQALDKAIKDACSFKHSKGVAKSALHVVFCGSLCGGTGSGALLDLGFLVRRIAKMQGKEAFQIACLALPEVMDLMVSDTVSIYANGYAFLRELNWYMAEPSDDHSKSIRSKFYKAKMGSRYHVNERNTQSGPFDICYTMSTSSDQGLQLNNFDTMQQLLAEAQYLLTAGTNIAEFVENRPKPKEITIAGTNEKRSCLFGGFGSYTVRFPAERVRTYLAREAGAELLGEWVINPPRANEEGRLHYEKLLTDDKVPLELEECKKRVLRSLPSQDLTFSEDISEVSMDGYTPRQYLVKVYDACSQYYGDAGQFSSQLQKNLDQYRARIVRLIEKKRSAILTEEGNYNAIGEASVYLNRIKRYCDGLTGATGLDSAGESEPTLLEQSIQCRKTARAWIAADSTRRQERVEKHLESLFGSLFKGGFEEAAKQAASEISAQLREERILEALNDFYKELRDSVYVLKLPLRYVQEEIAQGLKNELETNPVAVLAPSGLEVENGMVRCVCGDVASVENLVKPKISFFNEHSEEVRRNAEKTSLARILPAVAKLAAELDEELRVLGAGYENYLQQSSRQSQYRRRLRSVVEEEVGQVIDAELRTHFTIADVLMLEAKNGGCKSVVTALKDELRALATFNCQVFSGMDTAITDMYPQIQPGEKRGLLLNGAAFNAAVLQNTRAQSFSVESLAPTGQTWDTKLDDPFRISTVVTVTGYPLFALARLAEYHGCYDTLHTEANARYNPLHTDFRFEDWEYDSGIGLPLVEPVGGGEDQDVFLFTLATQDWWKNIEGFDPIDPPIRAAGNRPYYQWKYGGKDAAALGRENAVEAFSRDVEGVKAGIREELAKRWNMALSNIAKVKLLKSLLHDLEEKALRSDGHRPLVRCYLNEARVVKARLRAKQYDL